MSLGSVFAQPIMVYGRNPEPVELLSQFKGKRIAVGPEGSGTRVLALKFLKANGMDGPPTTLVSEGGEEAAKALVAKKIDAAAESIEAASAAGSIHHVGDDPGEIA